MSDRLTIKSGIKEGSPVFSLDLAILRVQICTKFLMCHLVWKNRPLWALTIEALDLLLYLPNVNYLATHTLTQNHDFISKISSAAQGPNWER